MNAPATIPTRRQLEREAMLDARLAADMREEAALDFISNGARRVFRWANVFGFVVLPLICAGSIWVIDTLWPVQ